MYIGRTVEISLSKFQEYNTLFLTTVPVRYIRVSELTNLAAASLYPLIKCPHFLNLPASGNHLFIASYYGLNLFFFFKVESIP